MIRCTGGACVENSIQLGVESDGNVRYVWSTETTLTGAEFSTHSAVVPWTSPQPVSVLFALYTKQTWPSGSTPIETGFSTLLPPVCISRLPAAWVSKERHWQSQNNGYNLTTKRQALHARLHYRLTEVRSESTESHQSAVKFLYQTWKKTIETQISTMGGGGCCQRGQSEAYTRSLSRCKERQTYRGLEGLVSLTD